MPTTALTYFFGWDGQFGDLLSFDLTNFAATALVGTLRRPQIDPQFGGYGPVYGVTQASTALTYIGGTTSIGASNTGVGRLQIVDVTNPSGMSQVGELRFPGTVHMGAPLVQGALGLSVGNTEGYDGGFGADPGTRGKLAFATLDLANRRAPELITLKISDYKPGSGGGFAKIGANLFALAGVRNAADQELLLVVDTSNPRNVTFREYPLTNPISSLEAVGKVLYATTSTGLRIYDIPDADAVVLSTCAAAVDAVFVVDRSTGVAGQGFAEAMAAAKRMMGQMTLPPDRVSVVSFTTAGTLEQILTSDKTAAGVALDRIIAGGNTYLGAGIELAQAELLGARRNPLAQPVIIVLSDGRDLGAPTATSSAAAATVAKAAGIKIITVGYGQTTAAGNAKLASLASSAGDRYAGTVSGTVGPVTVIDANTCQAAISILSSALPGPRNVETTTGTYVSTMPNAFTVQGSAVAPVATAVTIQGGALPAAGTPGTEVTLNLSGLPAGTIVPARVRVAMRLGGGTSTNVSAAATVFTVNAGGAGTLKYRVPGSIRVAQPTSYQLSVAGQTELGVAFSSSNTASFTLNPSAALAVVTPTAADPGKALIVTLFGESTHWVDGQTMASFGPGISVGTGPVGGFGRVDVVNATRAVAAVRVVAGATAGLREVEVQTGAESVAQAGLFRVNPAQTARVLTLVSPGSPDRGNGGTGIDLTATGFPPGPIVPASVRVRFAPATAGSGYFNEVSPSVIVATTGTGRVLRLTAPPSYDATPVVYNLTVSGTNLAGISFVSGNAANFTLLPTLRPDFLSQQSMLANETITLTVRVPSANFQPGVTQANFGPEIGVGGGAPGTFGPVNVPNANQVSITLRTSAIANGTRTVQIRTGTEVVAFDFEVTGPYLYSLEPRNVLPGVPTEMTFSGVRTNFTAATTVQFGPGWRVGGAPAGAPGPVSEFLNPYTVKVIVTAASDAEAFVLPTVRTGDEVLISRQGAVLTIPTFYVFPNEGGLGDTQTVTLDSYDGSARFAAGQSVANFGPGISVGGAAAGTDGPVTVTSIYRAQTTIVIQPGAPAGFRQVVVKTGAITATTPAFNGYRVRGPLVEETDPSTYVPGQSVPVLLYFRYVNLQGQTVTANFGPGIRVGGAAAGAFGPVTVLDATTARAQIEVLSDAPRTQRQLAFTVGGVSGESEAYVDVRSQISTIAPVSGVAGQTVSVRLTGASTQWTAGNLTMYADQGMRVGGALVGLPGGVAVTNATDATATVEIMPWLPDGVYSFFVFDGATGEDWGLYNVFTVTNPLPHLSEWYPQYATPGRTYTMTITGRNTSWVQGQTRVNLGPDLQINGSAAGTAALVTVVSPTQLTFTVTVPADLADGQRDLTVTTGATTQTRPNAVFVGFGPE